MISKKNTFIHAVVDKEVHQYLKTFNRITGVSMSQFTHYALMHMICELQDKSLDDIKDVGRVIKFTCKGDY